MRYLILSALFLVACVSSTESSTEQKLGTSPLAALAGDWLCEGTYEDLPPFVVAHTVEATFHVAPSVGGLWLTGNYNETSSSDGVQLAIDDSVTLDPVVPGAGIRTFLDTQTGQYQGGFTIAGEKMEHSGIYTFAHQQFPFTETWAVSDSVFTTEARLVLGVPLVFHRQHCKRAGRH